MIQPREVEMPPLIELEPLPAQDTDTTSIPTAVPVAVPVQIDDEEIYCPVCNYNLTGVFSGRCPECGALFDRYALIAAQQANQITLIPWDDPEEMPLRQRFWATLKICLVNPERFAFAFSVRPQKTRVAAFFVGTTLATMLIGLLVFLAYALGVQWAEDWNPFTHLSLTYCVDVCVFTVLSILLATFLSAVMLFAFCPHYDGKNHFMPWLSISAYASAHYMMTAAAIPVALVVPSMVARPGLFEFCSFAFAFWTGCLALCALTIRAVVRLRTSGRTTAESALMLLLLIHFVVAITMAAMAPQIAEPIMWFFSIL